jgi:hypothetical protein
MGTKFEREKLRIEGEKLIFQTPVTKHESAIAGAPKYTSLM